MANMLIIPRAGLPPVRINKARWPIVYVAFDDDAPEQHWTKAPNIWRVTLRRRADGRAAVIGRRDSKIAGHGVRAARYCGRYSRDESTILRAVESVLRDIGAQSAFIERVMRDVRNCLRAVNS